MKKILGILAAASFLMSATQGYAMEGLWKLTWKGPFGYTYEELEIRNIDGAYLGRLATRNLTDLVVDGDKISFTIEAVVPIGKIQMQFEGMKEGETLAGSLNIIAPIQIPPNKWKSVRFTP